MGINDLLSLCHDATSSRVIDAFIDSPTVPKTAKRKLVMAYMGHFHELVDDRIGSRVGDRFWAFAEPYLKEKIGRSLFAHEQSLIGSEYGKYFARKLQLHILKRRPEEWKEMQATASKPAKPAVMTGDPIPVPAPTSAPINVAPSEREKKKKRKADEIDTLFDEAGLGGKKNKRGALDTGKPEEDGKREAPVASDLKDVLGAIKDAPKNEGPGGKKKHRKKA
jgi:nucleolar protein 9